MGAGSYVRRPPHILLSAAGEPSRTALVICALLSEVRLESGDGPAAESTAHQQIPEPLQTGQSRGDAFRRFSFRSSFRPPGHVRAS